MWMRYLLGGMFFCAVGCGGPRLAPVSGTVTMDGKPLVGATVSFYPQTGPGAEPLDASTGKTDENGKYTLETTKEQTGAYVGKHRVSITLLSAQVGDSDTRRSRRGPPIREQVPARYNDKTELTFDVPSGGTTEADFPLKSPVKSPPKSR